MIKTIFGSDIVNRTELAQVLSMEQTNTKFKINSYSKEIPNQKVQKIVSLLHTQIYNTNITLIAEARKDLKEKRVTR